MKNTILVVEDDGDIRREIVETLQEEEMLCGEASTVAAAQAALDKNAFGVIVVDLGLPADTGHAVDDLAGIAVIEHALRRNALTRCVVLTKLNDKDAVIRCMEAGACAYVEKSGKHSLSKLLSKIRSARVFYERTNGLGQLMQRYTVVAGCPINPWGMTCNVEIARTIDADFGPRKVFWASPADADYGDEREAIQQVLEVAGLEPVVEMSSAHSGEALCGVCQKIRTAPYAIVDITGRVRTADGKTVSDHYCARGSILYELGLLHALGRKVAMLLNTDVSPEELPYDLRVFKGLKYHQPKGGKVLFLRKVLCKWLLENVPQADNTNIQSELGRVEQRIGELALS